MASHKSVLHIQRGFRMSKSYAEQVMRDHCTITWVIKGETIRDTTDEERIELRAQQAQQAKLREPMDYVELPGLIYRPSESGKAAHQDSRALVAQAHQFFREACGA